MECEFCGAEISAGALACPRCGSPVSKPAVKEPPGAPGHAAPPAPSSSPPRAAIPPWELDVTQTGAPQAPIAPQDVPLARQEEDFIALAEEMVSRETGGSPPSEFATEAPAVNGPEPAVAAVADQSVPPGAYVAPEQVVLDNNLTGGYKGAVGAASVAGAAVQTADDPFGLNITETAPPTAAELEAGRRIDLGRWWNILIMFAALLVAGAVAFTGVYFGFLRKKGPSNGDPAAVLREYCGQVIAGDVNNGFVPGATYQGEITALINAYEKLGVMSVKDFEATTTRMTETQATVEIKKFVVQVMTTGGTEYYDLLGITEPTRLRTTVNLVKQNGKWLVGN